MSLLEGETHPDLEAEQRHLERAYLELARMEQRTSNAVADAAERAPGDWDATVAHRLLSARLATMAAGGGPLCFGRIDEMGNGDAGTACAWHIGRRHVEDELGEPVVVDWRAPVAVPFYRATYRDPLGLARRRRFLVDGATISDLVDERFDDPDEASLVGATGLPDPLLAELGRARTGTMRDIVATIAAEQDLVIRAPVDQPLVVQGGPGTGKTAVGLHRAAWLLYEHRERLEREGVLVLGPNPVFLSYISEVLPSLGEVAVSQTTLAGLASAWRATGDEPAEVAALKGSGVMAEVIARAATAVARPPTSGHRVRTPWGSQEISVDDFDSAISYALGSSGTLQQRRARFGQAIVRVVQRRASERMGELIDREAVARALAADRDLQAILQRSWPSESPAGLLRRILGNSRALATAAGDLLDEGDRRRLVRRPHRQSAAEPWTMADLPLLDEAREIIAGVPRRYGHIVVDEAQDLSEMALRMVARRSLDGRSITILGDLAQATDPGAPRSWKVTLDALGRPDSAEVAVLSTGYRVPRSIMDLANHVLSEAAPQLEATDSVRPGGAEPVHLVAPSSIAETTADAAAELLAHYHSVAVVAAHEHLGAIRSALGEREIAIVPSQHASAPGAVTVITPDLAKGLEFDAVVIADPSAIVSVATATAWGLLYIALTRAVQELVLVSSGSLPAPLEHALASGQGASNRATLSDTV